MAAKPITLYGHGGSPNPWKVAIILEELGVPYHMKMIEYGDMKKDPYESINPNGRVPAIEDPNTGVSLWESGAIIQYVVDTYDKDHKLSYGDKSPEKHQLNQWLMYQMSGQGPYWGQYSWFTRYHPENVPSAIERYANEIKRVVGVIDAHLARTGTGALVGDKITYADLSFVPWNKVLTSNPNLRDIAEAHPHFDKWNTAMTERPAVEKIRVEVEKLRAAPR